MTDNAKELLAPMTPVREALERILEMYWPLSDKQPPLIQKAREALSAAPGEPCALQHFLKANKIMVVCAECSDNYPEGCGHFSFDMLRETPDGRWICEFCWDDAGGEPRWSDLPRITTPQPAAGWDDLLRKIEYATRKDSLTDRERIQSIRSLVCAEISKSDALRREAPAPAEGVSPAELIAALRTFPHFEGDTPVTPDAIRAVAKEYIDMVMTWEPQRAALEFLDHDGNQHWLVYEAGDGDLAGGWALRDDSNLAARTDTAEARLREALMDISTAETMLSTHIEAFHDFDYAPHEVPLEVSSLRNIQHHLAGSLIDENGNALSPPSGGDEAKESEGDKRRFIDDHHETAEWLRQQIKPFPPADRREIVARATALAVVLQSAHEKGVKMSIWPEDVATMDAILAALDGGR